MLVFRPVMVARAPLKKRMQMNKKRFVKSQAVGAGLFFLFILPTLIRAQGSPPPPTQIPPKASPAARAKKQPAPSDLFAGLQYTEEQKATISKIHQDLKLRMDAVIKDDKLSPDQKGAFLQGFERMEQAEVYKVLTPEQKMGVRKRALAQRQGDQKDLEEKKLPPQG
jgi:Spy/CpxP family protein refolding chaperone